MTKNLSLIAVMGAALVLGMASADDAQAWFGRGGGSNGSCGSNGGWFSGGGSNGSNGSHGGLFGGLFGRRNGGSHGSSGGSYNDCNSCNNCGCEGGTEVHDGDHHVNPPEAPKDPGAATPRAPGGGASATLVPNAAAKSEPEVMVSSTTNRRPILYRR